MPSINRTAFRIVGLFALLVSALFLSIYIFGFGKITTVQSLMQHIASLGFICIGIYGGIQMVRLRKVGHRLLIIWLLCQIFMIFFVFPAAVSGLFSSGNFPFIVPAAVLKPLIATYYLLYPVALIYLFATRAAKELLVNDNLRHIHILATLLSVLMPGLARALVDNLLVGMMLFYSYWLLITESPNNLQASPESLDRILKLLSYLGGWGILVVIDFYAVKRFEHSERVKNESVSDFAHEQVNGG